METNLLKIDPRKLTGEQANQLLVEGKLIPVDHNDPNFFKKVKSHGRPPSEETLKIAKELGLI